MGDMTPERKYQMVRLGTGDWMLPGNTGRSLWRLSRYREDGSAAASGRPIIGNFWSVSRYKHDPDHLVSDIANWEHWETFEVMLATRQAAINVALRYDTRDAPYQGEKVLAVLREHGPMTATEATALLPQYTAAHVRYMLDGLTLTYPSPRAKRLSRGRHARYEATPG